MTRFASVTARNVSDSGAYLDCRGSDAIPLYRLVYLQFEREVRDLAELPSPLRDGRVLSAVFRIGPSDPSTGTPSGYALRFLVEPPRTRPDANLAAAHQPDRAHRYAGSDLSMDMTRSRLDTLGITAASDVSRADAVSL